MMFKRTVSEDDLARLEREREEADERYNDALTGVDRALLRVPPFGAPLPPPDTARLSDLNREYSILPADPLSPLTGWRRRLGGILWRMVGPVLQRQQAFNATLVDHLNRESAGHGETRRHGQEAVDELRALVAASAHFQARLIVYLQQLTPYVDTKDREIAGLMRRINEDVAEFGDHLDGRTADLAETISGLADEMLKRWESVITSEQRVGNAYRRDIEEFQRRFALLQQSSHALGREFGRILAAGVVTPGLASGVDPGAAIARSEASAARSATTPQIDAHIYVAFEEAFRGSPEVIRERFAGYLPWFEGASDVLDIGCGRGEFLGLLREKGTVARGVDLNHEMVEICRERGLDVAEDDAVGHVAALPDGSLGGLFAAQFVEHLQPDALVGLLDLAYRKLRPGAHIILETVNPSCWIAFFHSYIRDITHVRPIHPDTLRFLLQASGFQDVSLRFSSPYPEDEKLKFLAVPPLREGADPHTISLARMAEVFNRNVEHLNALIFTHLDYAAIGTRG
jgi:SAM-dependent methyltransferase